MTSNLRQNLAEMQFRLLAALLVTSLLFDVVFAYDLLCSKEIASKCRDHDSGLAVYYADPEDCRSFCECSNGVAWHFTCDYGLLYDDRKHVCDWADLVDCGSRPIPEPN